MPKSCRSILKSLLYKGAIDERTYGKLERNMYGSDAQVVRWNTGTPKHGGRYLVTRRVPSYTEYGKTTHIVSDCSYGNIETYYGEKKRCWYMVDSEYGDYEVDDVVSWAAMPAGYVPEEVDDGKR